MDLASLPSRPLSLAECRDLEESDRFRTLVPAGVFDLAEQDHRLVSAVVLVTGTTVVAAGYALPADADTDTSTDLETDPDAEGATPGGWTVVAERAAPDGKEALEETVQAVGAELRAWAEGQPWADEPSALLDAL